ncbi:hypothetical protein [Erysipelothrix rhusiopathiae]|uniref:hypothetical protein n=1 Tax=Erysipelothrix rhusiopathiae TaxID=1648 RepID=UPI0039ECA8E2
MFSYDIGLTSIYNARGKKVYFSEHKIEKSSKVKGNFSDYIHENRTSELEIYLLIVRTKHYLTTFLGDEIDSEGITTYQMFKALITFEYLYAYERIARNEEPTKRRQMIHSLI